MGKITKGAKGKRSLKIKIVALSSAAVIAVTGITYTIRSLITNRNYDDGQDIKETEYMETVTPETENPTETGYTIEETTQETPQYVIDETIAATEADSTYADLLDSIEDKAQSYCAENRTSLSQIDIISVNNIMVNKDTGKVAVKGEFKNSDKFGNYIFSMENANLDLDIFTINDANISTEDFVNSLNQIMNEPSTTFGLDARQRLIDFSKIDTNKVVENIVKDLPDSTEKSNLIDNIDETSFSLLLNSCVKNEDKYNYTYTVVSYTKDYIYSSLFTFTTDSKLSSSALMNKIKEDVVSNEANCSTVVTRSDNFEKSLHDLKNQNNNELTLAQ